jgi:hypothetical protein
MIHRVVSTFTRDSEVIGLELDLPQKEIDISDVCLLTREQKVTIKKMM